MQINKKGFITLPILLAIIFALGLVLGGGVYWFGSQHTDGDWGRGVRLPNIQNDPIEQPEVLKNLPLGAPFAIASSTGTVPLVVTFTYRGSAGLTDEARVDFGDGNFTPMMADPLGRCGPADSCVAPGYYVSHLYVFPGVYHAVLTDEQSRGMSRVHVVLGTTTVTVVEKKAPSVPKAVSIPTMNKYTNAEFGFSFWYPADEWGYVLPITYSDEFLPGKTEGALIVGDGVAYIYEVISPSGIFIDESAQYGYVKYFFDPASSEWKVIWQCQTTNCHEATTTAKIIGTTFGNFPIFPGISKFGTVMVPLSPTKFLVFNNRDGVATWPKLLADTITLPDAQVDVIKLKAQARAIIEDPYMIEVNQYNVQ